MPIDDEVKDIKAPEGKFAVCLWDSYPRRDPPVPKMVNIFDTEEEANRYSVDKNTELQIDFYERGGEQLTPLDILRLVADGRGGKDRMIEPEYFVMDDRGCRID